MQSDYIMRMIEQFIQAIASIIRSRKARNHDQALKQIQFVSQKFLDTDISTFLKYTPDQLIDHFKVYKGNLDTDRAVICADLLHELALICAEKQSNDVSVRIKVMCLNLYVSAIPIDNSFQTKEYMEKVENLIKEIPEQKIPENVQINVRQYYIFLNQY